MTTMRAKMQVASVMKDVGSGQEHLKFYAVSRSSGYPADGADEDNTYARWSPQGELTLTVANPNLYGQFKSGDKFYLDFTRAVPPASEGG